jgi:N-methylhydantoinase B
MATARAQSQAAETAFDPILMAVLANRFDAVVREMSNTLFRIGRSAILNTARDFSCSVVTADDRLLSAAEGLPVQVLAGGRQTECMREFHPDLAEGDAFLHNDPYLGNTHTADYTVIVPVFVEGTHLFTVCAKAHQADCGNSEPSTYMPFAKDVYQEGGLIFPCVRIQRGYQDVGDVIRMCRQRIRVPEVWYGDYLAALGSARIGEQRLKTLVGKYGLKTVREFIEEWFNYSERRMAHAIAQFPAGRLSGSGRHDPLPGLPDGIPVSVVVEIKPEAGLVEVDLRDNLDCVPAGINLSETCSTAAALIGVLNCIDSSVPRNAGSFRRIRVRLRENCVVGIPRFPASCSMATSNLTNRLINATQQAFASLGERYGLAEGGASVGVGFGVVSGNDFRSNGAPYINQFIVGNNGGPATPQCDGWVTFCMPDSAACVLIDSTEVIEQKYPLVMKSMRLVTDSGGAGRFRGGPAGEVIYGPLRDRMTVAYFAEMNLEPAKGVSGGLPGSRSLAAKIDVGGREEPLPPIGLVELSPGEWIRGLESGGGGYGDPLSRDPQRVLHDVLEGWVSEGAARETYGVVLRPAEATSTVAVDVAATDRLRRERKANTG